MDIVFRFEQSKAQIVLSPTTAIDEANLKTMGLFGDRNLKLKLGNGKDFIVESDGLRDQSEKAKVSD